MVLSSTCFTEVPLAACRRTAAAATEVSKPRVKIYNLKPDPLQSCSLAHRDHNGATKLLDLKICDSGGSARKCGSVSSSQR